VSLRTWHERSRGVALLLAVGLAFAAQYLYTGEVFTRFRNSNSWDWLPDYSLATGLLAAALACAMWAFFPHKKALDNHSDQILPAAPRPKTLWLWMAGGCYLLALGVYLVTGENPVVQALWLAGVGCLILPLWRLARNEPTDSPIAAWEWGLVAVITAIGFGLRYWNITEIPAHVDNDVSLMGTFGLRLINAGQYNWIGFSDSGHLLSYDQFLAWSMRLFGQNHYGLVMRSVLMGTASLPIIFLLGRELGGRYVGLIASALLAISYTNIHFSRILFGASASFSAVLAFYFLFRGLRTRQPVWFALVGVVTGWGLLAYDSSRVIPLIILSLLIWQVLWRRSTFRIHVGNWLILLAGLFIAFGPMLGFALRDFEKFAGRGNSVILWVPEVWQHETAAYETTNPVQVLIEQTWRTFLTLHLTGDRSPHFLFPRPMTAPLTAALFVLGLAYCLPRLKDLKYVAGLSWVGLTFIFGGVLTADPPYWPHLNIASPAIALVAALGGERLMAPGVQPFGRWGARLVGGLLAGAIIFTGITNWQAYYDFVKDNPGSRIGIARYINSLPAGYQVYMLSPNWTWDEYTFQFLNRGRPGKSLTPEELTTDPPVLDRPAVFILFTHPELALILQERYPTGEMQEYYRNEQHLDFIAYTVIPPGYTFSAAPPPFNPLSEPGWWVLGGCLALLLGRAGLRRWQRSRN
jgi:hypothetical protein